MFRKKLVCKIGNVILSNPIIAASGTFGYGKEMQKFFDINMLGGLVTKTITLKPKKGNKPPRIYDLGFGVINSIGLRNPGLKVFKKEYGGFLSSLKTKVFISIYGENFTEWKKIILSLEDLNIVGFELNLSCPNIKKEYVYLNKLITLVKKLRPLTKKMLIVKLPFLLNIKEVVFSLQKAGIDAVTLINTLPALALNREGKPILGNMYGGLSGPCIKPIALRCVYRVASSLSLPVIGCGGIMDYKDVLDYLNVGAKAVQIGTANLTNPLICKKIIKDLSRYYEKKD